LDISAEEHDRLQAAFFAANPQAVEKSRLLSVYLDTPDAILRENDQLWCFSRKDKIRDGRLKPGEWRLDRDMDARSFVKKNKLFNRLGGVFTLRLDRESILHHVGQTQIEICLDRAVFRHGEQSAATSEAHFTLREGEAEALVEVVSSVLPHAMTGSAPMSHVERGYQLAGLASSVSEAPSEEGFGKTTPTYEAFKFIVSAQIEQALAENPPLDSKSVKRNKLAARRVRHALQFFANVAAGVVGDDANNLVAFVTALEKLCDLEAVLSSYLKPAEKRGRWEGAGHLVARIDESRTRAYAGLAQTWPEARIKNMYAAISEKLEAPLPLSVAGAETLSAFLSRELTKAAEEVRTLGKTMKRSGSDKPHAEDSQRLKQAVAYFLDVTDFFEPLTKGKSAKRRIALNMALDDLLKLLERDHRLRYAQTLVADAAAHIARLKQTKTQNAQTYAAGALAGYLEALKPEEPNQLFEAAFAEIAEVKPFWAKND
jgi:inorganic triphosphatase YgiF